MENIIYFYYINLKTDIGGTNFFIDHPQFMWEIIV